MPKYDPYAVRRCVRLTGITSDDVLVFASKSMTADDPEDKYHPAVSLSDGAALCDCPHFRYRLARLNPSIHEPSTLCKHLLRCRENLIRRGLL